MIKRYLVIGIVLLFIFMSINPSFAFDNVKKSSTFVSDGNTLYVGGNGTGNYTRIQDAIDNAVDGDTVFVYDDSSPYNDSFIVDKSITLKGENMNTTIIHGCCSISSNYVIISDFMFQIWEIPGMNIEGFSNNIIENCIFNRSSCGIRIEKSDNNIIRNCSFIFCEWGVLTITFSDNNEVSYCDFIRSNMMFGRASISISGSRGIKIHHCNITRNYGGGLTVALSFVQMTSNNIFNNDDSGVKLRLLSFCDMRNNWWGGPDGPNVTMYFSRFFEMHWGLGPVTIRKVDNGDSVIYTRPIFLLGFNRIRPWLSEPVVDAGQQA